MSDFMMLGNPVTYRHVMIALLVVSVVAGLVVAMIWVATMHVVAQPPDIPV